MNRDREFRIRLTEREHAEIKRRAYDSGVTVSEYIRMAIHGQQPIHRPMQIAVQHYRSLQGFQMELLPLLNKLPREDTLRVTRSLDVLMRQGKQMI